MLCWQYIDHRTIWEDDELVRLYRDDYPYDDTILEGFKLSWGKNWTTIDFHDDEARPYPLVAGGDTIAQAQQLLEKCLSSHGEHAVDHSNYNIPCHAGCWIYLEALIFL